jgi:ubiquinone/menaquinone biosynthesis C-methylase UbiE
VDISSEIVKNTNQRLGTSDSTRVEISDIYNLRFGDSSFDICFTNSVLHHRDLPIALAEIHRVLHNDGKLVTGEPDRRNPQVWWIYRSLKNRPRYRLTPDEEAFMRTEIKKLLQQHFINVSVSCFDFWHLWLGRAHEQSFHSLSKSVEAFGLKPLNRRITTW